MIVLQKPGITSSGVVPGFFLCKKPLLFKMRRGKTLGLMTLLLRAPSFFHASAPGCAGSSRPAART